MAFDTYTTLKASIADWLNRSDMTAVIPDFITLCEAEMKRRLRRSSTRTTITVDDEAVTPPTDMAELRSAYLVSDSPSQDTPLDLCTPEQLARIRARNGGAAGRPTGVGYVAGQLLFAPVPDQDYTAEIVYFTQLSALSVSNATNAVLQEAPDAYLFGSLSQAEPYLENETRMPTWKAKFDAAIDQLNDVRDREEYNASVRNVTLPYGGFSG